ncbi:MAG: purine-binding chemotaxis protein CheW [Leptospiraceae bacterium]|nr:purine-binding chemotaxis protein CheW [Leptospiraceae bacterium]MCP5512095.1 purine-binding chemotaxis protein CheW [Leptospiraceae bacterium]
MEENQYLSFVCGTEVFAIEILHIKEIKEYATITSIPMMPPSVQGVINLRGNVVPIIDLNLRIGREKTSISKRTCIIIVEVEYQEERLDLGLLVDSVSEVVEIPMTEIEKAPSFGSNIRNDFIRSIGKIAGKFIIILDMEKVLSVDELSVINTNVA